MQGLKPSFIIKIIRNSIIIILSVSVLAIIVNYINPSGIDLIAKRPIEVFVPCPDARGEIKEMSQEELHKLSNRAVIIDARKNEDYNLWHFQGAINIEYDFLQSVCPLKIKEILWMKKEYVIVYGDGQEPDSGRELAKELADKGIKNVYYIPGGVLTLKR